MKHLKTLETLLECEGCAPNKDNFTELLQIVSSFYYLLNSYKKDLEKAIEKEYGDNEITFLITELINMIIKSIEDAKNITNDLKSELEM